MHTKQHHTIQTQQIVLELENEKTALKNQQIFSTTVKDIVAHDLEDVFSRVAGKDTYLKLNRMEIDLGEIIETDLEKTLSERIPTLVEKELRKNVSTASLLKHQDSGYKNQQDRSPDIEILTDSQLIYNWFIFFVKNGYFPWWAPQATFEAFEKDIKQFLNDYSETQRRELLEVLSKDKNASLRLINQFSEDFLETIIPLLLPVHGKAIVEIVNGLKYAAANDIEIRNPLHKKKVIPSALLNTLLSKEYGIDSLDSLLASVVNKLTQSISARDRDKIIRQLYKYVTEKDSAKGGSELLKAINTIRSKSKEIFESTKGKGIVLQEEEIREEPVSKDDAGRKILISDSGKGAEKYRAEMNYEEEIISDDIESHTIKSGDRTTEDKKTILHKEEEDFKTYESVEEVTGRVSVDNQKFSDVVPDETGEGSGDSSIRKKEKKKISFDREEDSAYYINNAGLVILVPFLPTLFKELQLINENDFIDIKTRCRAVHIMQYLVTAEKKPPEHLLVLNKILCGIPVEETIERDIDLTEKEISEADDLLVSAIKHWSALKGTSPAGLREGFLQRDGKLEEVENGWRLYVERKTIDVLLSKIPWGFSIIKLPWNKTFLYVEW